MPKSRFLFWEIPPEKNWEGKPKGVSQKKWNQYRNWCIYYNLYGPSVSFDEWDERNQLSSIIPYIPLLLLIGFMLVKC